jgi:hypothetical protein
LIPAVAGLLRLAGDSAKLVRAGVAFVFIGAIGLVALMGLSLLASEVGALSGGASKGAYVEDGAWQHELETGPLANLDGVGSVGLDAIVRFGIEADAEGHMRLYKAELGERPSCSSSSPR